MNVFQGFPRGGFAFLQELNERQDREWFKANKERYLDLWQRPMEALLETLASQLAGTFPSVNEAPWKVFRIYNDTRFSKKAPFKTHVAGRLPISAPPGDRGGLYVQLGLEESLVAAGRWMMEPEELSAYRAGIDDDETGTQFERAVRAAVKKGYVLHSFEQLKRVPTPYEKEHPRRDLLTRKGLSLGFPPFRRAEVATPLFASMIVRRAKAIAPVLRQLDQLLLSARD